MENNLNRIINQSDIARLVTKNMCQIDPSATAAEPSNATANKFPASARGGASTVTPQQVIALFRSIGNFINFMNRKTQYDCLIADIYGLGSTFRNSNTSGFIPSNMLQQECRFSKIPLMKVTEPCQRQELTLTKMASMIQASESTTAQIMSQICKAIASFVRQEKRTIVLDFGGLNSNEVLCIESDTINMIDKKHMKEAIIFDQSTLGGIGNAVGSSDGGSIFNRTGGMRASCRLNTQFLGKLNGSNNHDSLLGTSIHTKNKSINGTEIRSVRSGQRSLTIQSGKSQHPSSMSRVNNQTNSPGASPEQKQFTKNAESEQKVQEYHQALQHFLGDKMSQTNSPRDALSKEFEVSQMQHQRNGTARTAVFSSQSSARRQQIKPIGAPVENKSPRPTAFSPQITNGKIEHESCQKKQSLDEILVKSPFKMTGQNFYKAPQTADAEMSTRPSANMNVSVRSFKPKDTFEIPKQLSFNDSMGIPMTPTKREQLAYTPQIQHGVTIGSEMPGMLEKTLPNLELLKEENKLNLKQRLERQKQMTLNNEIFAQTQPFGKFITYSTPVHAKRVNPEIQHLMEATHPTATMGRCLKAGTSNLGQEAFQVIRNQNRMRTQLNNGDAKNYDDLIKFQTVQMDRRQKMVEDIAQHHEGIAIKKEQSKETQREFGRYWRMQMEWNAKTASEKKKIEKNDNPEEIWTIEGPTRKMQERIKKDLNKVDLRNMLNVQHENFKTNIKLVKETDQAEGQRLQQRDQQMKEDEDQMHHFKKQMFAQEMRRTWEQQKAYKKSLHLIEDLY